MKRDSIGLSAHSEFNNNLVRKELKVHVSHISNLMSNRE